MPGPRGYSRAGRLRVPAGRQAQANIRTGQHEGENMDLYCARCGEPWDMDSLHEEAGERYGVPYYANDADRRAYRTNPAWSEGAYSKVYRQVSEEFRAHGCSALRTFGANCEPAASERASAAGAMYDLLGDDLDGAASMLADLGL